MKRIGLAAGVLAIIGVFAAIAVGQEPDRTKDSRSLKNELKQKEAELRDAQAALKAMQKKAAPDALARRPSTDPFGQAGPSFGFTTRPAQPAQPTRPGQAPLMAPNGPSVAYTQNFTTTVSPWRRMDPETARQIQESNQKINKLIKGLKGSEDETEKEKLKDELKTELEAQYDIYLEQHEKPLNDLEERLEKLRKEFEWRKKSREDLVKLKLDTIWYDSQGLSWPGANQTHPNVYGVGNYNYSSQNSVYPGQNSNFRRQSAPANTVFDSSANQNTTIRSVDAFSNSDQ